MKNYLCAHHLHVNVLNKDPIQPVGTYEYVTGTTLSLLPP